MKEEIACTSCYSSNEIFAGIEEFIRQQKEYTEKTLAEIITKYDFIVGSRECKHKLMKILPEGANIICSSYIESPTTIYAIKKFEMMDLLVEPQALDKHYAYHMTGEKIKNESVVIRAESGE